MLRAAVEMIPEFVNRKASACACVMPATELETVLKYNFQTLLFCSLSTKKEIETETVSLRGWSATMSPHSDLTGDLLRAAVNASEASNAEDRHPEEQHPHQEHDVT